MLTADQAFFAVMSWPLYRVTPADKLELHVLKTLLSFAATTPRELVIADDD